MTYPRMSPLSHLPMTSKLRFLYNGMGNEDVNAYCSELYPPSSARLGRLEPCKRESTFQFHPSPIALGHSLIGRLPLIDYV